MKRSSRRVATVGLVVGLVLPSALIAAADDDTGPPPHVLDKAKERVINHLSHELKTPLSIITGVLARIRSRLEHDTLSVLNKTLDRGERNVKRLIDLQTKIDDILNQQSVEEIGRVMDLIESAYEIIGDLDLRVSWIWDYISEPAEIDDGEKPDESDTQLFFGIGYSF